MDEDDLQLFLERSAKRRRRAFLYTSFLLCLLGAALLAAAAGTNHWFEATANFTGTAVQYTGEMYAGETYTGHFSAGLFRGDSVLTTTSTTTFGYYTVCSSGYCMYSCASTRDERRQQLLLILDGRLNDTSSCLPSGAASRLRRRSPSPSRGRTQRVMAGPLARAAHALGSNAQHQILRERGLGGAGGRGDRRPPKDSLLHVSTTDGLLSQGLWGATLAGLAGGLLFAALGAVFAVINTATTPVEAVTGIPGLYLWNVLAAVFELLAVICWAVQFKTRLTSNVLLVQSSGGWTTEGGEGLGYSYWLVVVAVVIHLVNCAIIGFGTYEPKVKEKIQEPDKATNDILLY